MTNYKESTLVGSVYTRAKTLTIHNPLTGLVNDYTKALEHKKRVIFAEETIANINNTYVAISESMCHTEFNPTSIINLRNPETGEPTGNTVSHAELYVILYSLYLQTAEERDAAAT